MNFLRGALIFVLAAFLQWWWSTRFGIWGLTPQILLALTVAISARLGPNQGMCYGFAWGLFLDVLRPHVFGGNAFVLMLVGYGTGTVRRQIDVGDVVSQCAIVALMTWGYFLIYGLLGLIFAKSFFWMGWPAFLFDPLYNCLLVPFTAGCCHWLRPRL